MLRYTIPDDDMDRKMLALAEQDHVTFVDYVLPGSARAQGMAAAHRLRQRARFNQKLEEMREAGFAEGKEEVEAELQKSGIGHIAYLRFNDVNPDGGYKWVSQVRTASVQGRSQCSRCTHPAAELFDCRQSTSME
jgi:hypothetical protein